MAANERMGSFEVERHPDRVVLRARGGPALSNMFATVVMTFFMGFCVLELLEWDHPVLLWVLGVFALGYGFAVGQDTRSAQTLGHYDVILRFDQRSLQLPSTDGRIAPVVVMVDDICGVDVVNTSDGMSRARGVVVEGAGERKLVAIFRRPTDAERLRGLLIGELRKMKARFFSGDAG